MLRDMKNSLRVSGDDLDVEVQDLIEAAKVDLSLAGIHANKIKDDDPLIKRAITLYCKANFGYEDPQLTDRFQKSYLSLKQHLSLSVEFTVGDK